MMIKQKETLVVKLGHLSYLWLIIGAILLLFANGKWIIPLAVWLFPVFILRFLRTQSLVRGCILGAFTNILVFIIAWKALIPIAGVLYFIVAGGIGLIFFIPFLFDRLISNRIDSNIATLVFPLIYTSFEYINSLLSPYGTWGSLAYTQYGNLPLMQLASVTGIWGMSFLITWFASIVNRAWEQKFVWQKIRSGIGVYTIILAFVLLAGGARLTLFPPTSDTVVVAGVQSPLFEVLQKEELDSLGGDLTQVNWNNVLTKGKAINDDLFRQSEKAARMGAKIIFWPEAMAVVTKQDETDLIERGRQLTMQGRIYLGLAYGAFLHQDFNLLPDKKMLENKEVLIDPKGNIQWEYLKAIAVPGIEAMMTVKGDGKIPKFDTPYGRIASAICYDMDFPSLARKAGKTGTDIIFIPSGDYKDIDPYHTQIAVFRAIENGFSLVRITKNGLSIAADYQGRTLAAMDYFTTQDRTLMAHVPQKGATTIYSQVGDLFAWLCIALAIAVSGWTLIRKRGIYWPQFQVSRFQA